MTAGFGPIGLPEVLALTIAVALNAYCVTGGADFGGGVWDLLASGPRRDAQRALISREIGPIWEANHVWLIFVIVILFTAFPSAFAALGIILHIPLTLVLIGIVLRGTAFVIRRYGVRDDVSRRRWGLVFAITSTVTPIMLGVGVGAIVSGAVGRAAELRATANPLLSFAAVYVMPWLSAFPLTIGVLALGSFAFLAAVYLAYAADTDDLREDFRRRALASALALAVFAIAGLLISQFGAEHVAGTLIAPSTIGFQTATVLAAVTAIWALLRRRWGLARVAAATQVSLILWGWVIVQYPFLVPPSMTVRDAAAPRATLELLLLAVVAGGILVVPSLLYLFRTFSRHEREDAVGT